MAPQAPSPLTLMPMGAAPEADWLDSKGRIEREHWASWIARLRACGWTQQRIADELGTGGPRMVRLWEQRKRYASAAVRRLAWRALIAPMEAEVNRSRGARPAPLQAAQRAPAALTPEQARALLAKRKGKG